MKSPEELIDHALVFTKGNLKKRLPFLFQGLRIKPEHATIKLTARCNFRCIMCGLGGGKAEGELSSQAWQEVLRQLREIGISHIHFSGGEPLLRSDLPDLVAYAHSLKFKEIYLSTNGYLLDENMAERLISSGLNNIVISIDALNEDFDRIRGIEGGFKKVYSACLVLSKISKTNKLKFSISLTIMQPTLKHIMEVVGLTESLGGSIIFSLLDRSPIFFERSDKIGRFWIEGTDILYLNEIVDKLVELKKIKPWLIKFNYADLAYIKKYFIDPRQKDILCFKSLKRIFIGPEGKVYGGCWSAKPLGDVSQAGIRGIVNSSQYAAEHNRMLIKDCSGCSCGYTRDLRYAPEYILSDLYLKARYGIEKACGRSSSDGDVS